MRTCVYVDGFNLYYGAVAGTNYKWLDIVQLCRRVLPQNTITKVRYFTALVKETKSDPTKSVRQQTFIRALETLPEIEVTYGSFLTNTRRMPLAPARPEDRRIPKLVSYERQGTCALELAARSATTLGTWLNDQSLSFQPTI